MLYKLLDKLVEKYRIPGEFNIYDQVSLIREHSGYPKWLPMPCWYEHGIYTRQHALECDLIKCKFLMLVNSEERKKFWQRESKIPAVIIGGLFPHYRRKNNIEIDKDAKGTVVFPVHTHYKANVDFSYEKYCEELKALPEEFHPLTICLHPGCVQRGYDKIFKDYGFTVLNAQINKNNSFAANFYNILKKHKYSTSNVIGSYTFYAVEMGIPFFLYGNVPVTTNNGELPYYEPKGKFTHTEINDCFDGDTLFSTGPTTLITKEQRAYIDRHLGTNECLSPGELKRVLFLTLIKNIHLFLIHYLIDIIRRPKKYARLLLVDIHQSKNKRT